MTETIIEAAGVTKYFGAREVLNQLSFSVRKGEVYALLGRNGVGKTTAIQMVLGFLTPTRGSTSIFGHDSQALSPECRSRIGYLAEGHHLYGWMRVDDLARFTGNTHPRWNGDRFRAFVDYFGLDGNQRVHSLSNGERAQVSLSTALACDPEVLVMDDPTLGVDPATRRDFLRGIVDLVSREQRTVLFTTHILSDVERIADRIGIIDQGALRVDATLDEFRSSLVRYHLVFDGEPPEELKIPRMVSLLALDQEVSVTVVRPGPDTEEALGELGARNCEPVEMSLEDAFVDYTSGGRARRGSFAEIATA